MTKKTFKSFDELADNFSFYQPNTFQMVFRISNSWKHWNDKEFNATLIGAVVRYYKTTQSLGARLSILGINFNLSLHFKRK